MSSPLDELAFEPTQHDGFQIDRRDFLKALGGGLLICLTSASALSQESGRGFGGHELPQDISAWLHIGADGKVSVYTGKVEVGQNVRTSLAQSVAEELKVSFDSIQMVMGDTDLCPWDAGTFGSRSTPTMGPQLRAAAATARQTLLDMAARKWSVEAASLMAADGKITDAQHNRAISYGELTRGEKLVKTIPGNVSLTPASEWKIAGSAVSKANGRDFVTGQHKFPSDIAQPGMVFGKVLRPDGLHAKLASLDSREAEKISGVKVVRDGDFAGVVAEDPWAAEQGVKALRATWNTPVEFLNEPSNQNIFEYFKKNPVSGREGSRSEIVTGSVADAMNGAEIKLEAQYTVQYIAHAPLEPRAAVAQWEGEKLTVWTGTQRPFAVRDELASEFHLSLNQVRVLQPDMGSGYGGKHTGEAAIEAARLAKAAGKPVKVVWTREEEFNWAYLRPAGLIEIRSGVKRDGTIVAWEHHNYNSGPAAMNTPYNIANQLIQFHPTKSPLRQGSYRGLASTANHFARESHMDEAAHAVGIDPLAFRLKNCTDERLRAVYQAAAEKFGWGKEKSTPVRGFGIAGGFEKGGHVATCVEVEIDSGSKRVKIRRVVQAWESGAIVNPNGLRNQVSGAIVQAIGGALFEAIQFGNDNILNPHFADYRLPRFSDTPQIEIVLLDRKDLPSAGAGETGIVGLAPAVGNAIFAATGTRLRNMPMAPLKAVPGVAASPYRS